MAFQGGVCHMSCNIQCTGRYSFSVFMFILNITLLLLFSPEGARTEQTVLHRWRIYTIYIYRTTFCNGLSAVGGIESLILSPISLQSSQWKWNYKDVCFSTEATGILASCWRDFFTKPNLAGNIWRVIDHIRFCIVCQFLQTNENHIMASWTAWFILLCTQISPVSTAHWFSQSQPTTDKTWRTHSKTCFC